MTLEYCGVRLTIRYCEQPPEGVIMTDFLEDWTRQSDAHARLAAQERLITEVTETIWKVMEESGINKTDLANRIGATKGHVSQVLNGSRNMTLRTLADICFALELKPTFDVKARQQRVQHGSIVQKQEASKSVQ
jgi:DNA-binding Xre family transcriptional regulator